MRTWSRWRRLGPANPSTTWTVYAHAFQHRDAAALGEQLAAFMRKEAAGCELVATAASGSSGHAQTVDLMVARGATTYS